MSKGSSVYSAELSTYSGFHSKTKSNYQRKYESYLEFFVFSLCYAISIDSFTALYRVGHHNAQSNLIQYLCAYTFIGIPLFYMQMILGQYSGKSVMYFKHMTPLGHGVIYTAVFIVFLYSVRHGTFFGDYCLYCLLTWQNTLPWMVCKSDSVQNAWGKCYNGLDSYNCTVNCINNETFTSAYLYYVATYLGVSPDINEDFTIDFPNLQRTMSLITAWTVTFIFVSIVYTARRKVLYLFLAMFYILLILLNMGTVSTVGGMLGIRYLFQEDWEDLGSVMIWSRSIAKAVKDLKISHAYVVMNASKLRTKTNAGIITVGFSILTFLTNMICSLSFQSCIGMLIRKANMTMDSGEKNIGIEFDFLCLFTIMPQSLGFLAVPQIWSMVYFCCAMTMILANQVTHINMLLTTIADIYPGIARYHIYTSFGYCGLACFVGASLIGETNYKFSSTFSHTIIAVSEMITISYMSILVFWIYGVRRLGDDVCFMTGTQPIKFWKITWYIMPFLTTFCAYYEYYYFGEKHKHSSNSTVKIIYFFICICAIPIFIFIEIFKHIQARNLTGLFRSTSFWGPLDPEEKLRRHLFNPRKQTAYQSKTITCQHNCLLTSKVLKSVVESETRCTMVYLDGGKDRSASLKTVESRLLSTL